jgi:hypothetical protein
MSGLKMLEGSLTVLFKVFRQRVSAAYLAR